MAILKSFTDLYTYIFEELPSPLTKDWCLVSSPLTLFAVLIIYNVFCAKIGPKLMENRKPCNLKTPTNIYNLLQVLLNLYLSYEGCIYLFSGDFSFRCQGVREGEERVARAIQVYLFTKLIQLLDTIFFVFRKSHGQITFLHLYYHTSMPILTWILLKYLPGGQTTIYCTIDSIVHVAMYMHYFLTSLGPQFKEYLWHKKYLILMQYVQFIIVAIHSFNSSYYNCDYPYFAKCLLTIFSLFLVYKFHIIYYINYVMRKPHLHRGPKTNGIEEVDKKDSPISNGEYAGIEGHDVNEDKKIDLSRIYVGNENNTIGSRNNTNNGKGNSTNNGKNKNL